MCSGTGNQNNVTTLTQLTLSGISNIVDFVQSPYTSAFTFIMTGLSSAMQVNDLQVNISEGIKTSCEINSGNKDITYYIFGKTGDVSSLSETDIDTIIANHDNTDVIVKGTVLSYNKLNLSEWQSDLPNMFARF